MATNKINIIISAKDQASKPLRKVSEEIDSTSESASKFNRIMAGAGKIALAAGATGFAVLATGAVAASKASWEQVGAVEQATLALRAYEKDGSKVNTVLGDLIKYARTDMGVLFNRRDLFDSAQNLKLYGDNTESLTDHVKILSRSVGLGLSSWDGLNNVIGRVGSTGRLYADDLQYLQNAGFKLDKSLSGSTQTFESLFALLDQGIPVNAMDGQATTIQGLGIRMQTAFRGVGDSILGVDKDTSKFVEGGLGDRFRDAMVTATGLLKDAAPVAGELTNKFLDLVDKGSKVTSEIGGYLAPSFTRLFNIIRQDVIPAFKAIVTSDAARFLGSTLVGSIKLGVDIFGSLLSVASKTAGALVTFSPLVFGIGAAFAAYKLAVIGTNVVMSIQSALALATGTRYMMLNGTLIAVRTATIGQTIAQTALNVAMSLNPVGLVIAAVAGLAAGIWLLISATQNSTEKESWQNQTRERSIEISRRVKEGEDSLKDARRDQEGANLALERAERNLASAVDSYGRDSLEAREAALQLRDAKDRSTEASGRAKKATEELTQAQKDQRDMIQQINDKLSALDGKKVNYTIDGQEMVAKNYGKHGVVHSATFASGSNSTPGGDALVGEHGPERVRLPAGAQVTPAYRTRSESGNQSSGHTVIVENVNINNGGDYRRLLSDIGFALETAS